MRNIVLFVLLIIWVPSVYAGVLEDSDAARYAFAIKDYSKAFNLYKKLAEDGHAPEQFLFAEMLRKGQGTEKNTTEAAKWYAKAKRKGVTRRSEAYRIRNEEKRAIVAAEEAEKEDRFKGTPKYYQQKAITRITDAKFRIVAAKKTITHEKRIGALTGYVNKSRIYEAGSYQIAYEDELKRAYKDYKLAGGKLPLSKIK